MLPKVDPDLECWRNYITGEWQIRSRLLI